jgi:hypothetical protein
MPSVCTCAHVRERQKEREEDCYIHTNAFWTGEVKASSEKKYSEPEKTTRALFLACRAAISSVFRPTACGYCKNIVNFIFFVACCSCSLTAHKQHQIFQPYNYICPWRGNNQLPPVPESLHCISCNTVFDFNLYIFMVSVLVQQFNFIKPSTLYLNKTSTCFRIVHHTQCLCLLSIE